MKRLNQTGVFGFVIFCVGGTLICPLPLCAEEDEAHWTDELIAKDWSGILDMEIYYVAGLNSHPLRPGGTGLVNLRITNPTDDIATLPFYFLYSKGGAHLFPESDPPEASYYSQLLPGDAAEYTGHGMAEVVLSWFDETGDLVKKQRTVPSSGIWIDANDRRHLLLACLAPDREGRFRLEVLLDTTHIAEGASTYNVIIEKQFEVFRGTATAEGVLVKRTGKGSG